MRNKKNPARRAASSPRSAKLGESQGALFESSYLRRSHPTLMRDPKVALTELVANAWDAGATRVEIRIPGETGAELSVSDNGTGMTHEQFQARWMRLGYDRLHRQGPTVTFPAATVSAPRRVFGRNGVGRHSLFCFSNKYVVRTWRDGTENAYTIEEDVEGAPFGIIASSTRDRAGNGTTVSANVLTNLPDADEIISVLSQRFLQDPQFEISVNGVTLRLETHANLGTPTTLTYLGRKYAVAHFVEADLSARKSAHHGVAFWLGPRVVGTPSWAVNSTALLDRRVNLAKRLSVIIKVEDWLSDQVKEDWSGFRSSPETTDLLRLTSEYVLELTRRILASRADETSQASISANEKGIVDLPAVERGEVVAFAREVARADPGIPVEDLSLAVEVFVRLQRTRTGQELVSKLGEMTDADHAGLNEILNEWSVRDAQTVLDIVGRRLREIEAIERLNANPKVDELQVLHPLVTRCRWLFGAEFDGPEYASNRSLRTIAATLFPGRLTLSKGLESRRPDLVFLSDGVVSITGLLDDAPEGELVATRSVLLLELKKGGSLISDKEMMQAQTYVQAIVRMEGKPRVRAFVVGAAIDPDCQPKIAVGNLSQGQITPCDFQTLMLTARRRLLRLNESIQSRFAGVDDAAVLEWSKRQRALPL